MKKKALHARIQGFAAWRAIWPFALRAAVVILPIAVFWPALRQNFFWDDESLIVSNEIIRGLGPSHLFAMLTSLYMTTWQPLGWLVYAVIYKVQGLAPVGFQLAALTAHGLVAGALFATLTRLLSVVRGKPEKQFAWEAAFCSLLFSLHPLQASSAGWATEIPDMLATAAFLFSIHAYLGQATRRSLFWFFASCLFRWKGVALPVVLIALDLYAFRRPVDWRGKIPFAALSLGAVLLNSAAKSPVYSASFSLGALGRGLLVYPCQSLLAWRLLPVYSIRGPIDTLGVPGPLAFALCLGVTIVLFALRRRYPGPLAAWVCYAAIVAPPLIHAQQGVTIVYPHHGYLSMLPIYALVAGGMSLIEGKKVRFAVLALLTCLVAGEASLSSAEIRRRGDPAAFWTRALSLDPDCLLAYDHLIEAYGQSGRYDEAFIYLQRQLRLNPGYPPAQENLQRLWSAGYRGKIDMAGVYDRIGMDLLHADRADSSFLVLSKAIALSPRSPLAHAHLALALLALGRLDEARSHIGAAQKLKP